MKKDNTAYAKSILAETKTPGRSSQVFATSTVIRFLLLTISTVAVSMILSGCPSNPDNPYTPDGPEFPDQVPGYYL